MFRLETPAGHNRLHAPCPSPLARHCDPRDLLTRWPLFDRRSSTYQGFVSKLTTTFTGPPCCIRPMAPLVDHAPQRSRDDAIVSKHGSLACLLRLGPSTCRSCTPRTVTRQGESHCDERTDMESGQVRSDAGVSRTATNAKAGTPRPVHKRSRVRRVARSSALNVRLSRRTPELREGRAPEAAQRSGTASRRVRASRGEPHCGERQLRDELAGPPRSTERSVAGLAACPRGVAPSGTQPPNENGGRSRRLLPNQAWRRR
jgi:hypothetical protein